MKNQDTFKRMVLNAMMSRKLPDDAYEWDIVEALYTSPIVGSGESATWRSQLTIRLNGKQVWQGSPDKYDREKPLDSLGKLTKVGQVRHSVVYVIDPRLVANPSPILRQYNQRLRHR